eukprot:TRINITY_DN30572_c1_g2_i1.p1 TRINITY_DN30572_c1_g2~~TRINITY_DN30572_c1_g2_i1.p1  ORF type:complete len:647 (+),score=193.96 TRINITY_DN30572_c1_g2_i1:104-2044(+)
MTGLGADGVTTWLGSSSDAALLEDDEVNKKQALRNRRIRGMLAERKKLVGNKPKAQGGFDDVEEGIAAALATQTRGAVADPAKSAPPPPWFVHRSEPSVSLRLHEELLDFAAFIRPTPAESAARRSWLGAIEAAATALWPKCKVDMFGSTSTGLNLPNADVDVAVNDLTGVRSTTALKMLAEKLLERDEVSKLEIIQSAKVPVMKLTQRSTGLMADVVINRTDGLDTSKFIRDQIELYPALTPLVLFMKLFLLQRGLAETFSGGMGSYLLVCVVLSFLQRHPSAANAQLHATTTLGMLLLDFFRHFGQEFKYASQGMSLLSGGSLFSREVRGWTATDRNGKPTLCLESPLEPTVDIGSRCFKIGVLRAAFNHAYHVLATAFTEREALGLSLLSPRLINAQHEIIASRHQLMKEQPAALVAQAKGVDEESSDEDGDPDAPPKRRRLLSAIAAEEAAQKAAQTASAPVNGHAGSSAPGSMGVNGHASATTAESAEVRSDSTKLVDSHDSGSVAAPAEVAPVGSHESGGEAAEGLRQAEADPASHIEPLVPGEPVGADVQVTAAGEAVNDELDEESLLLAAALEDEVVDAVTEDAYAYEYLAAGDEAALQTGEDGDLAELLQATAMEDAEEEEVLELELDGDLDESAAG